MLSQKNTLTLVILGILLILISIILFRNVLTGRVIANEDKIKIGGAFGLTGYASQWGEADLNGAKLAIEEFNEKGGINGKKIELITEDIQSDGVKTVNAVNKLITIDDVDFIIGPTWLDSYGGAAPLAEDYDKLMITPSASITAIKSNKNYKNVFSTWFRGDKESESLVNFLEKKKIKKIVLCFGNDPFWQDISLGIKEFSKYRMDKGTGKRIYASYSRL